MDQWWHDTPCDESYVIKQSIAERLSCHLLIRYSDYVVEVVTLLLLLLLLLVVVVVIVVVVVFSPNIGYLQLYT